MTFVCKISVFTSKPQANLNWLFVLGHSLLRPTSNNLKNVLPEILRCLVPECPQSSAWFLTPFPPWVWAMKEPGWCTRNFRSCSYPFGHWSALNTPCYLCSWASSLSTADVLLLSEEELVHRCHHVSVQINKIVGVLCAVGSAFIISAVSGTSMSGECTKLGFILGEHGRGPLRDVTGRVRPRRCSALPWGVDNLRKKQVCKNCSGENIKKNSPRPSDEDTLLWNSNLVEKSRYNVWSIIHWLQIVGI